MVAELEGDSKRPPPAMKGSPGVNGPEGARPTRGGLYCGGNNSDATSSREDSDSDCTCDVESSNHDSGRFSADLCSSEPIIAPPSPFVTRSTPKPTPPPPLKQHLFLAKKKNAKQNGDPCCDAATGPTPLHSTTIYIDGTSTPNDVKKEGKAKKIDQKKTSLSRNDTEPESNKPDGRPCPPKTGEPSPPPSPPYETPPSHAPSPQSPPILFHTGVNSSICKACSKREVPFFNPGCSLCWGFLGRPGATPSQVFAVLRLWVPEVQKCIGKLVRTALTLGCGVKDKDAVTDMTLLHYAVKAGAYGIGDPLAALQVVADLIHHGADLCQRCKWTSMTALHYAAYFDVPNVLELILKSSEGVSLEDPCLEYSNGTALHIAAANLSEGAVRVLLRNGASPWSKDSLGRTPQDCIPSADQFELVPDLQEIVSRMQQLFRREWNSGGGQCETGPGPVYGVSGRAILTAVGLKIGDRVLVAGMKTAILRYAGPTEFATGLWAGVELESPQGRHNGTVKGVVYFRCARDYGMFVPINRLTKIPNVSSISSTGRERRRMRVPSIQKSEDHKSPSSTQRRSLSLPPRRVNHGRVNVSKVASKVAQDIRNSERKIVIGDRVCIDTGSDVFGVVRYTGGVHFASGYWIGVELDEARGSHDGSVCGTRYFTCRRQHGIFAASSRVTKINNDSENLWSYNSSNQRTRSSSINSKMLSHQLGAGLTESFSSSSSSSSTPFLFEEDYMPLALPGVGHSQQISKTAFYPTNTSMNNLNRCFSGRYISSRQRQDELQRRKEQKAREPKWQEAPPIPEMIVATKRQKENPHWLQLGHNVFYKNKVGIVRYIGLVHFAEGTWLGVELREKRGRHDGKVDGKRYFSCRNGFGVMVPPSKVTVHGLNGSKLVKQEEETRVGSSYDDLSIL